MSIVSWEVIGAVFAITLGTGLGVLGVQSYRWAKVWFAISAAILAVKLALVASPVPTDLAWLAFAFVGIAGGLLLGFRKADALELRDSNLLVAGSMPTPAHLHSADFPDDALLIFFGSNVAYGRAMPHTIIMMKGQKVVVIDRHKRKNSIVLSLLRLFDDKGEIVARIDETGFWIAPGIRRERPNKSSLAVFDRTDNEILRVTFLNRRAFSITGVFRYPGIHSLIRITPEVMEIGSQRLSNGSFGESVIADISLG